MKKIRFGGRHIAYLDGIRGIAILYVLLSHTSNNGWHLVPNINMAMSGKIGVWLFFVLSSFLLTTQLLNAYRQGVFGKKFLTSFFIARLFRIYPLYISTLLFIVIFVGWFGYSDMLSYLTLQETSKHLWAIPVEFKFYLMLPIIFYFYIYICRENLLVFLLPFVLFFVLFTSYGGDLSITNILPKDLASPWKHLPVFLLGFIGAVYSEKEVVIPKWVTVSAFLGVIIVTPMLLISILSLFGIDLSPVEKRKLIYGVHMEFFIGVLWLIIVLGTTHFHLIRKTFEMRFFVFTGQISFSLYLLHYFLFSPIRFTSLSPNLKAVMLFAAAYIIADFSYRHIEQNGMTIGKSLSNKLKLRN